MAIISALTPEPDAILAGIVEADEAHLRESRKGARECAWTPVLSSSWGAPWLA